MLEEMHQAVYKLLAEGCKRENLIICYSPSIKRHIEHEAYTQYPVTNYTTVFTTFDGVEISETWPYNEIVVYDKVSVCYYPHLIRKIQQGTFPQRGHAQTFVKQ